MNFKQTIATALLIALMAALAMVMVAGAVSFGIKNDYLTAMSTVISTAFAAIAVIVSIAGTAPKTASAKGMGPHTIPSSDAERRGHEAGPSFAIVDAQAGRISMSFGGVQVALELPPGAVQIVSNLDQAPPTA